MDDIKLVSKGNNSLLMKGLLQTKLKKNELAYLLMDFLVTWRIIFLKYLFERSFLSHLLDVVVEDAEVRGVFLSGSISPTLFRQL